MVSLSVRFLLPLAFLTGCASIWGFDDLTLRPPDPETIVCISSSPCAAGCTTCNLSCVNLLTDSANCGACSTLCTAGRTCQHGACECLAGQQSCGGICSDVSNDTQNCGACGTICTAGGVCNAGTCTYPTVLATGQGTPGPLVVDGVRVYWSTGLDVRSVAVDGTDPTTPSQPGGAVHLALDQDNLYLAGATIQKVPLTGAAPTVLVPGPIAAGAITVDTSQVYWVESGTVNTVPIAGGGATVLTAGSVDPTVIAVDASGVYYANLSQVWSTPLTGGSTKLVGSSGLSIIFDLVLSGGNFYIAGGGVGTMDLAGTMPRTLTTASSAQMLAVDEQNVYFFDSTALKKIPIAGGTATTLAIDPYPKDIAVDAVSVYWTSGGIDNYSGVVMKIAK